MKYDDLISGLNEKSPEMVKLVKKLDTTLLHHIYVYDQPLCMDLELTPMPSYLVRNTPVVSRQLEDMVVHGDKIFIPCLLGVSQEKYRTDFATKWTKEDSEGLYVELGVATYKQAAFTYIDVALLHDSLNELGVETIDDIKKIIDNSPTRQDELRDIIRNEALIEIRKNEFTRLLDRYRKRYPSKINKEIYKLLKTEIKMGHTQYPFYEMVSHSEARKKLIEMVNRVSKKVCDRIDLAIPRHFDIIVENLDNGQKQVYVQTRPAEYIDFNNTNTIKKYVKSRLRN